MRRGLPVGQFSSRQTPNTVNQWAALFTKEEHSDIETPDAVDSDISEGQVFSVLEPSSYVFERNLQVKLHKLSAEDTAQWTKTPEETCDTNKGYKLRTRQSRASRTGISLRNSKVVNYRPMLRVSNKDVKPEIAGKKGCSSRPKLSGLSSSRIHANRLIFKGQAVHHQTCY